MGQLDADGLRQAGYCIRTGVLFCASHYYNYVLHEGHQELSTHAHTHTHTHTTHTVIHTRTHAHTHTCTVMVVSSNTHSYLKISKQELIVSAKVLYIFTAMDETIEFSSVEGLLVSGMGTNWFSTVYIDLKL